MEREQRGRKRESGGEAQESGIYSVHRRGICCQYHNGFCDPADLKQGAVLRDK